MRSIEKLEPSKHVRGRFLLWFEGERDPVRVTENEVLSFALYRGRTLSEEEYADLLRAGSASAARTLGVKLLGERPLSRRELCRRLVEKGCSEADAADAADYLEEIGALDEQGYAATIVRHYSRQGYGVARVRQELHRRGIPRELWEEALEELDDPEEQAAAFLEARFRTREPDAKSLKRATDALLRRGFRWDEIKAGLSRAGITLEEESV
ncbi:MAG: regulatory protein RecX [Oscillospiraceae bacterium]|nr:regulatory protein RecX [Oscillospiraceae bacterium]